MSSSMKLNPHEALELHEIMKSDITAIKKLQASLPLVTDDKLKAFMERTLQTKKDILEGYQGFVNI